MFQVDELAYRLSDPGCEAAPGAGADGLAGRLLSRAAGIESEEMTWRLTHDEPWFENHVATLELDGRHASITFEKAVQNDSNEPDLRKIFTRRLA